MQQNSTDELSFYPSPPGATSTPNHELSLSYNGNSSGSFAEAMSGPSSQNVYSQQDSGDSTELSKKKK